MKIIKFPVLGISLITVAGGLLTAPGALAQSKSKSKTQTPVRVSDAKLSKDPYRFNGVVTTGEARGSGFCAWNKRTFFSAAHVVLDMEDEENVKWDVPPKWNPQVNSLKLPLKKAIQSRGYYRWADYLDIVNSSAVNSDKAFGRDVILGFAFRDLIRGTPAKLNLNGSSDLRRPVTKLMTGYPAEVAYTSNTLKGYFLHETGPAKSIYSILSGSAMETTLISSGGGNSGGPIWTKSDKDGWTAAGVVVGGLPSETINYAFSSETNTLLRAVAPIVKKSGPQSIRSKELSASSVYYSSNKKIRLPDGVHKWTDVPFTVNHFENESTVTAVRVAVKVKTSHRGDLQIMLTGPGGFNTIVHNEQGAGARDLIIAYRDVFTDVSEDFEGIPVNGRWALRFQDRLKGDICTIESAVLELEAETPSDEDGGGIDGGLPPGTDP